MTPRATTPSRPDRRRRDREDDRLLEAGLPPGGDGRPVLALARRLRRILGGKGRRRASDAAAEIHGGFDRSLARVPPLQHACRKGCPWCCSSYVAVTSPEVFLIARHLRATGADDLAARIAEIAAANAGRPRQDRVDRPDPCPLLSADGACSVYTVRPTACRALLSKDLPSCLRTFVDRTGDTVPAYGAAFALRARHQAALRAALAVAGLSPHAWELTAALHRALTIPDAEERWLAGEDVFAGLPTERITLSDFATAVHDLAAALRREVV